MLDVNTAKAFPAKSVCRKQIADQVAETLEALVHSGEGVTAIQTNCPFLQRCVCCRFAGNKKRRVGIAEKRASKPHISTDFDHQKKGRWNLTVSRTQEERTRIRAPIGGRFREGPRTFKHEATDSGGQAGKKRSAWARSWVEFSQDLVTGFAARFAAQRGGGGASNWGRLS